MTEQLWKKDRHPREEFGIRYGFLVNFKERLGWENRPVILLPQKGDLKSQMGIHAITMACISPLGTGRILCWSFQEEDGTSGIFLSEWIPQRPGSPWRTFSPINAGCTYHSRHRRIPTFCAKEPFWLILSFLALVVPLRTKAGGCDWLQNSGTRWMKLPHSSQVPLLAEKTLT